MKAERARAIFAHLGYDSVGLVALCIGSSGGPLVEKALEMYRGEISINWFGVPGEAVICVLWGYKTYVFKIPGMTWYLKSMIGVRVTKVGEASRNVGALCLHFGEVPDVCSYERKGNSIIG